MHPKFQKLTRKDRKTINALRFRDGKDTFKCCLCGCFFHGYGNNPYPLCPEDDYESRCCDECDNLYVIPARIEKILSLKKGN